jgi:putative ABC transport system permease protein
MHTGVFFEIVRMAFDTIRTHKMRSALTILGVLIGVTSIVAMTSMVRGFDESLRDSIRAIGPETVFVAQFSGLSMSAGEDLFELMQRPTLTPDDARAIGRQAPSIASVNLILGEGGPPTQEQLQYRNRRTKSINVLGSTENFASVFHIDAARWCVSATSDTPSSACWVRGRARAVSGQVRTTSSSSRTRPIKSSSGYRRCGQCGGVSRAS